MTEYALDLTLDFSTVNDLLANQDYVGNLHSIINNSAYAEKLSTKAKFLLAKDIDIKGFVAYYQNTVDHCIYITLLAVNDKYRHQGIASNMIELLAKNFSGSFDSINLEVYKSNVNAQKFYNEHGFNKTGEKNNSLLLTKKI